MSYSTSIKESLWDLVENRRKFSNLTIDDVSSIFGLTCEEYVNYLHNKDITLSKDVFEKIVSFVGNASIGALYLHLANTESNIKLSNLEANLVRAFRKMSDDIDRKLFLDLAEIYLAKENA